MATTVSEKNNESHARKGDVFFLQISLVPQPDLKFAFLTPLTFML